MSEMKKETPKKMVKNIEPNNKINLSEKTELLRSSDVREADLKLVNGKLGRDHTLFLDGAVTNINNITTQRSYQEEFARVLPVLMT